MHRSLKFVHPMIDAPAAEAGLVAAPSGRLELVEGDAAVRQAILLLLATTPGERVMRPEYGCELHRLMFAPNDETTAGMAIYYVRRALQRWERRIDVVRLDAVRDRQGEALLITLEYRVRETQRAQRLDIALRIAGGGP